MRQKEELRREKEAARLRAAHERAIARRIAKESMELIEDERLELMELAASSKGLPSILSLDYEILQNLELYRGKHRSVGHAVFYAQLFDVFKVLNNFGLYHLWVSVVSLIVIK